MIIRRSIAGFVLSALIAGGTLFVVDRQTDEANRTVNEVTQRTLDYQREMTKAAQDGTPSAAQVDTVESDGDVPDAAKAHLEAAEAALEGIE